MAADPQNEQPKETEEKILSTGRVAFAVAWLSAVLLLGVLSRVIPDLQPCKTSVAEAPATAATESTEAADGTVTTKTTESPVSSERTTTCEPVSAGELGLLMLPIVVAIWPAIKGFNFAGIGADLREIEKKAAASAQEAAKEQVIRIILEERFGSSTEKAFRQAEAGDVVDLPDA